MKFIHKPLTKIAGVLLLFTALLFAFCYIVAGGGDSSENGPGAVWWLFVFFGVPSAFAGAVTLFISIFTELTASKSVGIGGKRYGLGSVLILVSLLALLAYILLH